MRGKARKARILCRHPARLKTRICLFRFPAALRGGCKLKRTIFAFFCVFVMLFAACGAVKEAETVQPPVEESETLSVTAMPSPIESAAPSEICPGASPSPEPELPPEAESTAANEVSPEQALPIEEPSVSDISTFAVDSSCFSELGYDEASRTLIVVFRDSGAKYAYFDFGADDYAALLAAPSLGKWYNSEIKGIFNCEAVN